MGNNSKAASRQFEIDLVDFLAQLLYKWKYIVIFLVAGVLLGAVLCNYVSKNTESRMITQEDVDAAKSVLSIDQCEQVEYLYTQYLSYKQYRKATQEYTLSTLYDSGTYNDSIIKYILYSVKSDIVNVNQCFIRMALGVAQYENIAEIIFNDRTQVDDLYRRIAIEDLTTVSGNADTNIVMLSNDGEEPNNNLLQIRIVADTEQQADAVGEIIEGAFEEELQKLKAIDSKIELIKVGSQYSSNVANFMQNRQALAMTNLNYANNALISLDTSYIEKLTSAERKYYNILKAYDEQEIAPIIKPSLKKYVIIGALFGIILAFCWFFAAYVLDGKIKTVREITDRLGVEDPYLIYQKKAGIHLFGGIARKLKDADLSDQAIRQNMVSSDLSIKMKKQAHKSIYIVNDGLNSFEKQVSEVILKKLKESLNTEEVIIGNPLIDPDELHRFSQCDSVVIIAQLKETKQSVVKKWFQLCRRYNFSTDNTIILEEC